MGRKWQGMNRFRKKPSGCAESLSLREQHNIPQCTAALSVGICYLLVILRSELLRDFVEHGFRSNGFLQGVVYERRRQSTRKELGVY